MDFIEPCFGIGHNLSLICQMTSEDIKHQLIIIKIGEPSLDSGGGGGGGGKQTGETTGHTRSLTRWPKPWPKDGQNRYDHRRGGRPKGDQPRRVQRRNVLSCHQQSRQAFSSDAFCCCLDSVLESVTAGRCRWR